MNKTKKIFFLSTIAVLAISNVFATVTVTAPTLTITTCSIFPTSYNPLGNIVITEGADSDFSTGTGLTLILTAPANFEFQAGTGNVAVTPAKNIDDATIAIAVTASAITITYDCGNTNKTDAMTISGILVRATATSVAVNVTRTGGTGTIAGLVNGNNVATLSCATVASPTAGTIVANYPNPVCTDAITQLSLSGSTTGTEYQWQDSPDNVTFTNIAGATSSTYNYEPTIATTVYFKCVITCGSTATTPSYTVTSVVCPCTATTYTVDLSSKTDTTYTKSSTNSGNCCNGTNCVRFIVTTNAGSNQVGFNVTPAPSGSGKYQVDCGPLTSIGTPLCILGTQTFSIVYCKPGGGTNNYTISAARTVGSSPNISIRPLCAKQISVSGMIESTITWTPVTYLSCSSNCDTTTVNAPSSGAPAFIDYIATGTATGCASGTITDTVRVTFTPALTVTTTATNTVICTGASNVTITASASGGLSPYTYAWSPGGFSTSSISVAPTATTSYTVSVNDAVTGCSAVISTITITSQATPSAPTASASPNPICEGSTLSLSATSTGTTYSWTGPNSFTNTNQNPIIASITTAGGGTYSVTATTSGCTSSSGTVSVTVNLTPSAPTASASPNPVCTGATLSLSASSTGTTYSWTGPNSFTSASQNPTLAVGSTAVGGTYSVTAATGGCTSSSGMVVVTVNQTPAAPAASASPNPVCEGDNLSLSASSTGTTYNWNGPNGFTSTSQDPVISPVVTADAGTYSVTAYLNGCPSATTGTVSVTVNPLPAAAGSITGDTPVCQGQSGVSVSVSPIANATSYVWVLPAGVTIVSGAGTNSIIVDFLLVAASGNIQVYGTNACCAP